MVETTATAMMKVLNWTEDRTTRTTKLWLLPIVHVINYHIRYYTKLPPVAIHRIKSEDTKTYLPIREANTQRVQSPKTGVMVSREGRQDVRKLLKEYIKV